MSVLDQKNCFGHKNRAGAHILLDYLFILLDTGSVLVFDLFYVNLFFLLWIWKIHVSTPFLARVDFVQRKVSLKEYSTEAQLIIGQVSPSYR